MTIEIKASLLTRFNALAQALKEGGSPLARRVFRRGLGFLEQAAGIGRLASLDGVFKKEIRKNPTLSHKELASRCRTSPVTVKAYRLTLAAAHLQTGHWQKETDGAIGQRFGLHESDVSKLRKEHSLFRIRGSSCSNGKPVAEYIKTLGGAETIRYALCDGGKTIGELFRDKGITKISSERERQIVGSVGCIGNPSNHSILWYANRLLGPGREELARRISNPKELRKLLADAGGGSALAALLKVAPEPLVKFARKRVRLVSANDKFLINSHGEMVELCCDESSCKRVFYRFKSLVEGQKAKHPEKKFFCRKICQGRHLGKNFGGAHHKT